MADTMARVAGPAFLTASAATLYTVPGSTTLTILEIVLCNEDSSDRTVTLSIGADAGGKRLLKDLNVPATQTIHITGNTVVAAAEIIQAFASSASKVTITISGVLTT